MCASKRAPGLRAEAITKRKKDEQGKVKSGPPLPGSAPETQETTEKQSEKPGRQVWFQENPLAIAQDIYTGILRKAYNTTSCVSSTQVRTGDPKNSEHPAQPQKQRNMRHRILVQSSTPLKCGRVRRNQDPSSSCTFVLHGLVELRQINRLSLVTCSILVAHGVVRLECLVPLSFCPGDLRW